MRGNTQVCLHDCSGGGGARKGFKHKTCSGLSGLVHSVKVTRVTHQGRIRRDHGDRAVTHKGADAELCPRDAASFLSPNVTL